MLRTQVDAPILLRAEVPTRTCLSCESGWCLCSITAPNSSLRLCDEAESKLHDAWQPMLMTRTTLFLDPDIAAAVHVKAADAREGEWARPHVQRGGTVGWEWLPSAALAALAVACIAKGLCGGAPRRGGASTGRGGKRKAALKAAAVREGGDAEAARRRARGRAAADVPHVARPPSPPLPPARFLLRDGRIGASSATDGEWVRVVGRRRRQWWSEC
jgi:hypothetical protein